MTSVYNCAGIAITLRSASARVGDALGDFLRRASGRGTADAPRLDLQADVEPDFAGRVSHATQGGRLLDAIDAPGFARRRYAGSAGFTFVYELDRAVASFDPASSRVQIWIADEHTAQTARCANLVVADVLRFALPFAGVSLLHAACVVVDGRGVLLCGPSGAGKSLLALRLMEQGAQLVGDDHVALRHSALGVECLATPEWMGMTPSSLCLFPQLRRPIERHCERIDAYFPKCLFRPEDLFPDVRRPGAAAALLIDLAPLADGPHPPAPLLRDIPRRDAYLNVVRQNYVPFHRHSMPHFAARDVRRAGQLVEALRTCRLVFSPGQLTHAAALVSRASQELAAS